MNVTRWVGVPFLFALVLLGTRVPAFAQDKPPTEGAQRSNCGHPHYSWAIAVNGNFGQVFDTVRADVSFPP